MADEKQNPEGEPKKGDKKPEIETRIDGNAVSVFNALGFTGRLPDSLVEVYQSFKQAKDRIQPGRLSAEGYATVVFLHDLVAGKE